jgi:hypothetical protein
MYNTFSNRGFETLQVEGHQRIVQDKQAIKS